MMGLNALFASSRLVSEILLFWNLTDVAGEQAVIRLLTSDDVLHYFAVKWYGWAPVAQSLNDVWAPFLSGSFPADPTPAEPT